MLCDGLDFYAERVPASCMLFLNRLTIPLSLYICRSMQHFSHMVLFTCLAQSHPWKVAFKLQHRKPNYTQPIHTHAHTRPAGAMSQISLCCLCCLCCFLDSWDICCYYLHVSISTEITSILLPAFSPLSHFITSTICLPNHQFLRREEDWKSKETFQARSLGKNYQPFWC